MESKFWFLTKHSLNKKIKSKWFVIANIIVAIVIIGLINIDSIAKFFGGDFNDDVKIRVVDNANVYDAIEPNLKEIKQYLSDAKVIVSKEKNSLNKLKKDIVDKKDIILVINPDNENVFNVEVISDAYIDTVTYQVMLAALNSTKVSIAMQQSNVDQSVIQKINKPIEVKRTFIDEDKTADEESSRTILGSASLVIVLPCFMLIVYLVQMIGAEINEEKSTRGMEIIIGNVSPKVHFFSKILSSNIFVLMQGVLMLIYGAIGLLIRKFTASTSFVQAATSNLQLGGVFEMISKSGIMDKLGYVIPMVLLLIILSFLAYSLLAGILASMTTNMENFSQLQTPLMVISLIGYYLIMISALFPGAIFMKIMATIPLISISLAPSLLLSGEIGVGIMIIAIIVLAVLDYLLIKYGLKIYKAGILNYSETGLWKKMFKAIKE